MIGLARNRSIELYLVMHVVVLGLCLGTITFLRAQQCSNRTQFPLATELKNRTPDANGIIHVTYSFSDTNIPASSKAAIYVAIAQWNDYTSSSKVKFDEARLRALRATCNLRQARTMY